MSEPAKRVMSQMPASARKRLITTLLTGLLFTVLACPALPAQEEAPISPAVKQSVDRAIAWLMAQQRAQGCFLDENRNDPVPQHSGAMTALAASWA